MFGYVRPYVPDMRVRENEMYRAMYCGLCRSMGRCTGCASRLTLSYDFVFLAAVRTALEGCPVKLTLRRCGVHPLKKRPSVERNSALSYSAACAAVLNRAKLLDDINDSRGLKKLSRRLFMPEANHAEKLALRFGVCRDGVYESLSALSELEKQGCPSADTVAEVFGELLGNVFSYGLEGASARIAKTVGRGVGKFIYIADAIEDREKDLKSGNYNPFNLSPASDEAISSAVRLELGSAAAAAELIDFSACPEIGEIIRNILYEGMPKRAEDIIDKCRNKKKGLKNDRSL